MPTETKKHEIFFSYAWGEEREKIVDGLYESLLKDDEFTLLRDKKDLNYKGLISDFMRRIGESNMVIVVISDKYLRSEYCMFELYEIFRNARLNKEEMAGKIFPVYVENISLGKAPVQTKYVKHWQNAEAAWEKLQAVAKKNFTKSQHDKLSKCRTINKELGELMELLSDMNALTKELLTVGNFEIIKAAIKSRAEELKLNPEVESKVVVALRKEDGEKMDQLIELLQKSPEQSNLLQKPEELQFAVRFADYDQILSEIKECEEELADLHPDQGKLIFKRKVELKAAQDKLIDFTKRVLATYETISQQPINTERSKKAKELFEGGDLDGAIATLSTPDLDNELALVKQKREHLQKIIEKETEKAKMVAEDFLSRARYQATKPFTPELIKETIESFEKSIEAFEYFDNLYAFGNYLWTINHSHRMLFYHEKALALHLNENGVENERHADLLNYLGLAWRGKGNLDKAIEYLEEALAIDLKMFGEENHKIAIRYNNLGLAWQDKGNLDKATEYLEKSLAIDLKLFGEENPNVAIRYNNLGLAWKDKGNLDNAIEYLEKALAISLKLFGEENSQVAIFYNNLGLALEDKGDLNKAISYLEKALNIGMKLYGDDNPLIAIDYNNLALSWQDKGDLDKAIDYLEKALAIDLKFFGEENPNVARDYNNLGMSWMDEGNLDRAIEYLEKSLAIGLKLFGEENPNVASNYNNLGTAWLEKDSSEKAIWYLEKSYQLFKYTYGSDNPSTQTVKENLDLALKAQAAANHK